MINPGIGMNIPFVDLSAQYQTIKSEIDDAIAAVIEENAYIGGTRVEQFEAAFAEAHGAQHCIAVANGTDAIYVVLKMLGIGPGDEVITVANSWISTSETISQTGARPVFVDVDEHYTIDVSKIEAAITEATRAIIPVHLYGQPADMSPIVELCTRHGLRLVEDCAQAHLAAYAGKFASSFGDAGTFSFYPGKNLGAYGDAGAILTHNEELATQCRMFARHGALKKHEHVMEGINSRLDGIQAAVLLVKLKYLSEWTEKRIRVAAQYSEQLADLGDLELPATAADRKHVFHLYVVRTAKRDALRKFLAGQGIATGVHYPTALPLLPAYDYLKMTPQHIPRAYANQSQILSLPMYPEMTDSQIEYVVSKVRRFFNS